MSQMERRKECRIPCELVQETHDAVLKLKGDLETKVETLWSDMYNGKTDGVKTTLTALVSALRAEKETQQKNDDEREKRQERRDAKMSRILTLVGVIIAFLALVFGVPPAVESIKKLFNGEIHYQQFFQHKQTGEVYDARRASPPETASK